MLKAEMLDLKSALLSTGLVLPVDSHAYRGHLDVMCRQIPGQEKPWLEVITQLLEVSEAKGLNYHVCRRYIRKDGKLVFGWHIQIEADKAGMKEAVESACKVMALAKPSLVAPPPPRDIQMPQPYRRAAAPGQHPQKLAAVPRSPGSQAFVPEAPPGYEFKETTLVDELDADGKRHVETLVPLPHVYGDLNTPSKPVYNEALGRYVGGGRGARLSGSGSGSTSKR